MKPLAPFDPDRELSRAAIDVIYDLRNAVRNLEATHKLLSESTAVREQVQSRGLNPDSVADYVGQQLTQARGVKRRFEMQMFGEPLDVPV